jgi:protoheme IX farnesyltransferase
MAPLANPLELDVARGRAGVASLGDYVQLLKPRIILLLIITSYCAMVVASHGLPAFWPSLLGTLGLALSAGGAHAVNMWYDRDIDALMARTNDRPVPSGRIPATRSLIIGIALEVVSFALLLDLNLLTALLSLGGFIYYVGIYTMWLKRRTPQNIVIGGGAGAFPPLIGWAAVTGHLSLAAFWMFLIIFLWTPAHFWSLALFRQDDYRRANVPMMPVARGERVTKVQSLMYTLMLLAATLGLYLTGVVGSLYLAAAAVLGVGFVAMCLGLLRERAPEVRWAKATFGYSLVYLTLLFAAMVLNVHAI